MSDSILTLREGRSGRIRPRHPWIYKNQIKKTDTNLAPGGIVTVKDAAGKFIGKGYFNPRSEIAVRILTFAEGPITASFIEDRIRAALEKRRGILTMTNACRIVFSESDNLPGLIIDIYDDTVVFQLLTYGMERQREAVMISIREVLKAKYVYEKSVSPYRKIEGLKDRTTWIGPEGKPVVEIYEGKAKFLVDIVNGHKTGFYLDQRKSRMALSNFSKDKEVFDLFCYTGAFGISAAAFGAKSVFAVDIKENWLDLAEKNASLNGVADRMIFKPGNAFRMLSEILSSGRLFDMVIMDPPSFLKKKESLKSAARGYGELNSAAMKVLRDGGILATFSCSYNMPNDVFFALLKESAEKSGRKITILKRCHQAEDHPIVRCIPETEYLKGYFLRVEKI